MPQLSSISAVKNARTDYFAYTPPPAAFTADRILVKPTLGYAKNAPVTVSRRVMEAVIKGLRRANPTARILIVDGASSKVSMMDLFRRSGLLKLLDGNMQAVDAEELPLREYPNLAPTPARYTSMRAPAILTDVGCLISVSPLKRLTVGGQPQLTASLENLIGLFPRDFYAGKDPLVRGQLHQAAQADVLRDVYFTIGHLFDGAVVDLDQKLVSPDARPTRGEAVPVGQIVWGDDLLAVDEAAFRLGGEGTADYVEPLKAMRTVLVNR
jgi:uncharacterized protein (DUF362 family)